MVNSITFLDLILISADSLKNKDDLIRIRKDLTHNEFTVTYTESKGREVPLRHTTSGMYEKKVLDYVAMVLKNQSLDNEPYAFIQVTVPSMPAIFLSGDKFKDSFYRDHVIDLVTMGLEMLETTESDHACPKKGAKYATKYASKQDFWATDEPLPAADQSNLEDGELPEGDYDMPPLIPESQQRQGYSYPNTRSSRRGVVPQHLYFD